MYTGSHLQGVKMQKIPEMYTEILLWPNNFFYFELYIILNLASFTRV